MTLDIQNLGKRYGDVAVFANVSLTVAPGEFVAIVGESGVGKSTLLNCMAGLDTWDTGTIALEGIDLATLDDDQRALLRRDKVGFVFQAFHVLPHLDVAQNVALPLLLQGMAGSASAGIPAGSRSYVQAQRRTTDAQATHDRVQAMLNAVGLEGLGARLPQQLSGGQLQRVSIARALVHRPRLAAGRRAHRQPRPHNGCARDGRPHQPDATAQCGAGAGDTFRNCGGAR